MRPPKQRQNRLLQPLDQILASPANVRLLRVLALRRSPLTGGELSKSAVLGRTSIYPALRQLEHAGVVEFIGAGAQRLVQLREGHPLSKVLRELFKAEAHRFEALGMALRKLLANLPHHPLSAWINAPKDDARNGDTLDLYLVAPPPDLERITDYVNSHLADIERKYDVHIALHCFTRSELQSLDTLVGPLSDVVLLAGVPPLALTARSRATRDDSMFATHEAHDDRSRRLALAIAAKVKRDPGLIALAQSQVKRRLSTASPRERRELIEWNRVLSTMSPARLRRFLVEDSERAIRLRQTLPMLNILSPAEREAVVQSRTDADVIAAIAHR